MRKLTAISLLVIGYVFGVLTVKEKIFQVPVAFFKSTFLATKAEQAKPLPNPDWPERKKQFEQFGRTADVVMIGDSLTHAGHWDDIFPDVKIANRGVGRDKTDDILNRMNSLFSTKASKAFLMAGVNDLGWGGKSVEQTFSDYVKVVASLRVENMDVYIQSTLECSKKTCGDMLLKIRRLNSLIEDYAQKNNINYININNGLTSQEAGLLDIYTYDGIHLLGEGYGVWAKTIAPYISQ